MEINAVPMARWSGVERPPLVIAGPCSAESEAQLFDTARRLAGSHTNYMRAGIWKARTRPNTFEGIGDAALPWLRQAADAHGLRTATEVAQPRHVEAALEHGIDLLWIGARTTVNPFSVQELANALRGSDAPVLVKNPTSPDLGLWLGALERIHSAGVNALGAIHRGFMTAGKSPLRNQPMWDIVIELRRNVPDLPILSDPSHIAGRRDFIQPLAQRAMDLGLEGLMIETHPNPDQAWSDANQQIMPERLTEILSELKVRRPTSRNAGLNKSLEMLRHQIDEVDLDLLNAVSRRMRIVEQIGDWKRANNVTSFQPARWRDLLQDRMLGAADLGLEEQYVKALYELIHEESVRRQSEIMDNDEETSIPLEAS